MGKKIRQIKNPGCNDIIRIMYWIVFGYLLLVLFFFSKVHYIWSGATKAGDVWEKDLLPNFILMPAGVILFLVLFRAANDKAGRIHRKGICLFLVFLSMGLQIYAARQYYMLGKWDPFYIYEAAIGFARGENTERTISYLSRFPNNISLAFLYSVLIRLSEMIFGQLNKGQGHMVLIVFQSVLNHTTGFLLYATTKRLLGKNKAAFTAVIYWLLVVISPWVSVPYSDSAGLIIPISILYIYLFVRVKRIPWAKWFIIGILTYFGYSIKPQAAIVSIAIIVVAVLRVFRNHLTKETSLMVLGKAAVFLSGIVVCFCSVAQIPHITHLELDSDQKYTWTHFVMMGLNEERNGVWDSDDNKLTRGTENQDERAEMNIRIAKERVSDMGVAGLAKHVIRKTLAVYNDGTFAWNGEGHFYEELTEPKDEIAADILRKIYYPLEKGGEYNPVWCHFEQIIWLGILFWCFIAGFGEKHQYIRIIMLSLIGLTIFELLFEARARYLYIYTPFFILAAAYGLNTFQKKTAKKGK